MYELACKRLRVQPPRAFFIDDIPENVEAALSIGMTAILFETTEGAIEALRLHFPAAFALGLPSKP